MPVHLGPEKRKHPRSIDAFCERKGLSRGTYYNLAKRGQAPAVIKAGARVIITEEAELEWERRLTVQPTAA